jgi:MFS family permease
LEWENWTSTIAEPQNQHYKNLQKCYLLAFILATFADWLQGPYVYKLYSDYGYSDDSIAILYMTGFASSCFFGIVVGQLADRYGRKLLCSVFGLLYSLCCLSKITSDFRVLLLGRVLGGVSTSILFTTFEAWYLNEHLNFFKMPPEWLNVTFTKATFYNGLSALAAGLVSQVLAEYAELGPVSPFLAAVPFLLLSLLVIQTTWKEHSGPPQSRPALFFSPLRLLRKDDGLLLFLGLIQSLYESVMYIFIFSWTPVLAGLNPPLGLVFSLFMLSIMGGSKLYAVLVHNRYQPHNLLVFTACLASVAMVCVTLSLSTLLIGSHDSGTLWSMSFLSLLSFLLYEFSVGMYYPAMGYLRGRVVPEECRATLVNWFRVPMNLVTCLGLTLKRGDTYSEMASLSKYRFIFFLSSILVLFVLFLSYLFSKKYVRKMLQDELADLKTGKLQNEETV